MNIKTLEQALKLQNDLATRLTHSLVSGTAGKVPPIEVLVKEKEQSVVRAQAEVEAAIKERDAAVSRWDERVAQRKENVAKLKQELDELKKQVTGRNDPTKHKETGKVKKEASGKKSR